jgi:hypothetical protein
MLIFLITCMLFSSLPYVSLRSFRSVLSEFSLDLVFRQSFSRLREKQAPVLYLMMLYPVCGIYKYKWKGFSGTQINVFVFSLGKIFRPR